MSTKIADIVAYDQVHIWHPYSATPAPMDPRVVSRTEGVHLFLDDGTRLIDAMSSWWAAAHGHGHPALISAANQQLSRMSHVMFGGLTHRPAVELTAALLDLVPPHFSKVFFADSGSVSVEVAMKMAIQYQRGLGEVQRTRFVTWRGGYHGDTLAPMSVSDPDSGMHSIWSGILPQHTFAPRPPDRGASATTRADYLAQFDSLIEDTHAAVIVEPVVQGAGGMRFHDPELLVGLRSICDAHGLLLIDWAQGKCHRCSAGPPAAAAPPAAPQVCPGRLSIAPRAWHCAPLIVEYGVAGLLFPCESFEISSDVFDTIFGRGVGGAGRRCRPQAAASTPKTRYGRSCGAPGE